MFSQAQAQCFSNEKELFLWQKEKLSAHNTHITFGLIRVFRHRTTMKLFLRVVVDSLLGSSEFFISSSAPTFNCDFSMANRFTLCFSLLFLVHFHGVFCNAIRLDMRKLKMRISQQITFLPAEEVACCGRGALVMFQLVDVRLAKDFYCVTSLGRRPLRFFLQHNSCLLSFSPQLFFFLLAFHSPS
jgi:hypothetical protein